MENHIKSTPRDVFMYLLVIATLYANVVSFISLLFAYIDVAYTDQLNFCYSCSLDQVRWSSSVLVVVFPVFVFLFRRLTKEFAVAPEKRELKIRKWLVYLTLFLAAVTVIVDLITLIFNFYSGELTVRFFLKTLVVLAVALAVFGYYLWDLKKKSVDSGKTKAVAWAVSLVVIAAIVSGFFIVGSPAAQRDRRFDERRVGDLQILQGEIISYWINKGNLPAKLGNLKNDITGFESPIDPQTQEPYRYSPKGALTFELCADFKTDSKFSNQHPGVAKPIPAVGPRSVPYQQNWGHGAGRACFDRTIDPDLYKIEKPRPL